MAIPYVAYVDAACYKKKHQLTIGIVLIFSLVGLFVFWSLARAPTYMKIFTTLIITFGFYKYLDPECEYRMGEKMLQG